MKSKLIVLVTFFNLNVFSQITFTNFSTYNTGNSSYSNFCADFNSDGKQDIACGTSNFSTNIIKIMIGNGNGTFTFGNTYSLTSNPKTICGGDFNNDGKIDIATGNNGENVCVLFSNGNGTFSLPVYYATNAIGLNSICTGDFNGDGNLDLATTNNSSSNVSVFLGNSVGIFSSAVNYSLTNSPSSIYCNDFNNDGNMDITCAGAGGNGIFMLLGNPSGIMSAPSLFSNAGGPSYSVFGGDFNNDSNIDIVTCNNNLIGVMMGNGIGSFSTTSSYTVTNSFNVLTADVNCDGNLDIICGNSSVNGGSICFFQGNGAGNFSLPVYYSSGPGSIAMGEFNSDGRTDLVFGYSPNFIKILLNTSALFSLISTSATICNGMPVTITANGATSYTFSGGVSNGIPFTPTTSSTYTVYGNIGGCTDMQSKTITVLPSPTITVLQSSTLSCSGATVGCSFLGANTWSINGLSSTQTQTFAPTITTTYTLTGKSSNGCYNSILFTHSITICNNIQSYERLNSFNIYPNPNNGNFIIESDQVSEFYFTLWDITGQLIYRQLLSYGTNEIKLGCINKGLYYYECINRNGKVLRSKVLIE